MNYRAAFDILCALLAPTPFATDASYEDATYAWEALVAVASQHNVASALWRPIAELPQATDDAKQYFSAMHDLNRDRNATLLGTVAQIVDGMGEVGIEPIFMKGVASLIAGLYDDLAERFLGDIDLLVPEIRLKDAAACLNALGYQKDGQPAEHWIEPRNHHLARRVHPISRAVVEIHRTPLGHPIKSIISSNDYIDRSKVVAWRGRAVRVPCETHRLVHNIAHEQLSHGFAAHGMTELRQLRELALLVAREGDRIDWIEVERRFERSGHLEVLRRHAATCAAFMRVAMPLTMADPADARARLSLSQQPSGPQSFTARVRKLIGMYSDGFRDEPRLALNLLNPLWWPARLRGWADALELSSPRVAGPPAQPTERSITDQAGLPAPLPGPCPPRSCS